MSLYIFFLIKTCHSPIDEFTRFFPHSKYLALQENEQQMLTSIADISTSIVHTTFSTTTIQLTTTTEKQRMSIRLC